MRTLKVDFLTFKEVEYSRTRVIDDKIGYFWDRLICYLKKLNWFVVVDVVKFVQPDYYTLATLWHTQKIIEQGKNFYITRIDSILANKVSGDYNLLIYFPESYAKEDSFEHELRHYQREVCVYQTISSSYKAGDIEFFITFLIPNKKDKSTIDLFEKIKLIYPDRFPYGVGFEILDGDDRIYICLKLDLDFEILRENLRPRYTFESGRIRYDKVETDAYFTYLSLSKKRKILYYAVSNFVKLNFDGKTIIQAKPYTFTLQLDGGPDRVGYAKLRFWEDQIKMEDIK